MKTTQLQILGTWRWSGYSDDLNSREDVVWASRNMSARLWVCLQVRQPSQAPERRRCGRADAATETREGFPVHTEDYTCFRAPYPVSAFCLTCIRCPKLFMNLCINLGSYGPFQWLACALSVIMFRFSWFINDLGPQWVLESAKLNVVVD